MCVYVKKFAVIRHRYDGKKISATRRGASRGKYAPQAENFVLSRGDARSLNINSEFFSTRKHFIK